MVMLFDRQTQLAHDGQHLGADVDARVNRGNREVAALDGGTVAVVALGEFLTRSPSAVFGVDLVEHRVGFDLEADVVENEEFSFRAEEGGVADAGGDQMLLGALGDRAGIAVIKLAGGGLDDVAENDQLGLSGERIDHGGRSVRLQNHVGLR